MIETVIEVSKNDANQSGDQSDLSSDSQESDADSSPWSATGNWLTCSDTQDAPINSACKKLWKKVCASCNIAKGCLWSEAQLKLIGDSHQAVWESDYEVIKTEWELTLKEDHHSFEVNKMTDRIDELLRIKEATHSKIHPCELEAEVPGREKTLVQSLKQSHAHFYWLYKKGTTHAMVSLQGLHSGKGWSCSAPGVLS